jgi:hypothetical protein
MKQYWGEIKLMDKEETRSMAEVQHPTSRNYNVYICMDLKYNICGRLKKSTFTCEFNKC